MGPGPAGFNAADDSVIIPVDALLALGIDHAFVLKGLMMVLALAWRDTTVVVGVGTLLPGRIDLGFVDLAGDAVLGGRLGSIDEQSGNGCDAEDWDEFHDV